MNNKDKVEYHIQEIMDIMGESEDNVFFAVALVGENSKSVMYGKGLNIASVLISAMRDDDTGEDFKNLIMKAIGGCVMIDVEENDNLDDFKKLFNGD